MMQEPLEREEYPSLENLWEFAGQGLRASDFNAAMIHFYRAEVTRSNTWRQRLDATTNWAVITTGAALSFAFGSENSNGHVVIIIDTLLVVLFLFIEARRYRYYELWTHRVRLMETNFISGLLAPPFRPKADWAERVTNSLMHPRFTISLGEALGRRYRRNYAFIFFILATSWVIKVLIGDGCAVSVNAFMECARLGPVPGWWIVGIGVVFNALLFIVGILTAAMHEATAEVLSETGAHSVLRRVLSRLRNLTWEIFEIDLPRLSPLSHISESKQLAYIITDNAEPVSKAVIDELGRGVTRLQGQGMFTGREHGVLMCAFHSREADELQRIVKRVDPHAFVIIMGVRDVRGEGFRPLEA